MRLLHNQDHTKIYRGFIVSNVNQACEKVRVIMETIENTVGMNHEQSFDVRVILSELLQNAIKHGNIGNNQKVYMNVWVDGEGALNITIKDYGNGFNICETLKEEKKRMQSDIPDLLECGRGLQIVKNLCDDIVFNRRGNCITVIKKL